MSEEVVWAPNSIPQRKFCAATEDEVFYGGAKGCAKSDAIVMAPLQQIHKPRYKALILRQSFPEVQELIDRTHNIFPNMKNPPTWSGSLKRWTFPGGGVYQFGYCKAKEEVGRYHGQEWAFIGFDEVADVQDENVWIMLQAENRCPNPDVMCFMRGTGNPGKPGHPWIKKRFVDTCGEQGETIYRYRYDMPGLPPVELTRRFIPARVTDNPVYANDPVYMSKLYSLPEILRKQLLYGDWGAGFGMALDELDKEVHMIDRFEVPKDWIQFGSFDWGFSHPWVFGHYAVTEDGVIVKINTYRGRLMSDRAIAEELVDRVDFSKLRYVVAGHDCWAEHKARNDDSTPSTADRFLEHDIYLSRANTGRHMGLRNFREMVAWKGRLEGGEHGEPNFYMMDTPGNRLCFDTLSAMMLNPDDPEDANKMDADPLTGAGGDDDYDETRYALASRPPRATTNWADQQVRASDRSVLLHEMEKRKHTSRSVEEADDLYRDIPPDAVGLL